MPLIPQHNTSRGTWCRFSGCDSYSGTCKMCTPPASSDSVRIIDQQSQHYGGTFQVRARMLSTDAVQVKISDTVSIWLQPGEYRWAR